MADVAYTVDVSTSIDLCGTEVYMLLLNSLWKIEPRRNLFTTYHWDPYLIHLQNMF